MNRIAGSLLGTAVGDAIGLPYEGISRTRAPRLLGPPNVHRFVFRRGMVSDDTEHSCMVAQALIRSQGDLDRFRDDLAWRFRWWLLAIPAGIGLATLRAILRLWVGFPSSRSGVFSAGNGPAMRAAILGAAIEDIAQLRQFVTASTRLTHTDPKADMGAFAVALAAQISGRSQLIDGSDYLRQLRATLGQEGDELYGLLTRTLASVNASQSTESFAADLGLSKGVTGYVYHTVPVAIHAWLSNPDRYQSAIESIIRCGGDTDTTAAIVGGIVGTRVGPEGIPALWRKGLIEWPRSTVWMDRLAHGLQMSINSQTHIRPPSLPVWGILLRNTLFLTIVLFHGFRRLLPPY